jgi:hypothetical protein
VKSWQPGAELARRESPERFKGSVRQVGNNETASTFGLFARSGSATCGLFRLRSYIVLARKLNQNIRCNSGLRELGHACFVFFTLASPSIHGALINGLTVKPRFHSAAFRARKTGSDGLVASARRSKSCAKRGGSGSPKDCHAGMHGPVQPPAASESDRRHRRGNYIDSNRPQLSRQPDSI